MQQPTDRKLLLRVTLKLMSILAIVSIVYIFMQYSFKHKSKAQSIQIDLSDLPPGESKIVRLDGRPILILHRTEAMLAALDAKQRANPYLVIYQQSPDYSCPVEIVAPDESGQGGFRAVCSGTRYDFAGQLLPGQDARFDLRQPGYALNGAMLSLGIGQ